MPHFQNTPETVLNAKAFSVDAVAWFGYVRASVSCSSILVPYVVDKGKSAPKNSIFGMFATSMNACLHVVSPKRQASLFVERSRSTVNSNVLRMVAMWLDLITPPPPPPPPPNQALKLLKHLAVMANAVS